MPNVIRRTPSAGMLILSGAVICLLLASGCKKEEGGAAAPGGASNAQPATSATATGRASPAADMVAYEFKGVTFQYPKAWKAEKSAEGDVVDLRVPVEDASWLPGVYMDVRPAADPDLNTAMDAVAADLGANKSGFHATAKRVLTSPAGFQYGRVEYTSLTPEQFEPLTQWHVIIPLGGGQDLTVRADALTATWPQYEPAFAKVVDSIRVPKKQ